MVKLDKLHIYLCIVAALLMTVVCMVMRYNLYQLSVRVSVTIIVFYGIGQGIRLFLMHKVFPAMAEDENEAPVAEAGEIGEVAEVDATDDTAEMDDEVQQADVYSDTLVQ